MTGIEAPGDEPGVFLLGTYLGTFSGAGMRGLWIFS
jgi:hypothetical protein